VKRYRLVPLAAFRESVVVLVAPTEVRVVSVVVLVTFVESVVLAVFLLHAATAAPAARARTRTRADFLIVMLVLPP
jgi:hypothetical protein